MAQDSDKHLNAYDDTALTAYSTCPTYGVIRYQMHKRPVSGSGRAMALEAGSAMHECFAWVRLCTLLQHTGNMSLVNHHGKRLYGADRFAEILTDARAGGDDITTVANRGAIAVLETGPFYDEPRDTKRTLANLEECALAYITKWNWKHPVWIRDDADPESDVGIEIPFDVVVTVEQDDAIRVTHRRYTGKIDGIRVINNRVTLEENKTASRLNEAWATSMHMRSQITGYSIAASVFTEQTVRDAHVHGVAIPLPKTNYDFGGVTEEHVTRDDYHFNSWVQWFHATAQGYESDTDNPYDALRFTHSCNRYFRPCEMIPFCDGPREEQEAVLGAMEHNIWSPLAPEVTE